MQVGKNVRMAVGVLSLTLLSGMAVGCAKRGSADDGMASRIEAAASRAEMAANKAADAANRASDAAARAEAAAQKAEGKFGRKLYK